MASLFYNRYIPPSIEAQDDFAQNLPAKRRKKNETNSSLPDSVGKHAVDTATAAVEEASEVEETLARVELGGHLDNQKSKRSKKKDKRKDAKRTGYPVDKSDEPSATDKHRTILSKYAVATNSMNESSHGATFQLNESDASHDAKLIVESHGLQPLPQPSQEEDGTRVSTSDALPDWLRNPILVSTSDSIPFADLPLSKALVESLKQKGFEKAFAVQTAVIPMLLPGPAAHYGDVCISAATGSGKTLAYALPMAEALKERYGHQLTGLVLVPTRELVSQARETLEHCAIGTDLRIGTAIGSNPLKEEQDILIKKYQRYDPEAYNAEKAKEIDEGEALMNWDFDAMMYPRDDFPHRQNYITDYRSKVDILICTPGRLVEHIKSTNGFTLEHLQWLVIDEADRLLEESFQQWVDIVLPELEYMPPLGPLEQKLEMCSPFLRRRELRKTILSATMTRDVGKLAALKLRQPKLVVLQGQNAMDDIGDVNGESHGRVELPAMLNEAALPVADIADKPLHLIRVLERPPSAQHPSPALEGARSYLTNSKNQKYASSNDTGSEGSSDTSDFDDGSEKSDSPTKLVPGFNATPLASTHGTLIFTNSNENAQRLARLLVILRPDLASQVGTLVKSSASSTGRKTIKSFQKRKLSIVIASDRASRGLDLQNLARVINYDMPKSVNSYVHRVGRTARAGKEGFATTFVAHHEARWFWNEVARSQQLLRAQGRKVQRLESALDVSKEERERYQAALARLGAEAQDSRARKDGRQQ
ncbi:MAG: hypothetical protein Q9217_002203 [Psora testacea]